MMVLKILSFQPIFDHSPVISSVGRQRLVADLGRNVHKKVTSLKGYEPVFCLRYVNKQSLDVVSYRDHVDQKDCKVA